MNPEVGSIHPRRSASTARSIDCKSTSAADRVCDSDEGVQWPNDKKPIFFMQLVLMCEGRDRFPSSADPQLCRAAGDRRPERNRDESPGETNRACGNLPGNQYEGNSAHTMLSNQNSHQRCEFCVRMPPAPSRTAIFPNFLDLLERPHRLEAILV
jgi:hypothetical protein